MQTVNDNQKFKYGDPTWYFIAEFSLREVTFDELMADELTAGSLFQMMRDLGIPPEYLKRIEGTITEATRGARSHFNHIKPDLPVHLCLFCHKKTMDNVRYSEDQMYGGWGYYVIERGSEFPNYSGQENHRVVELYLYKEGE